MSPTDAKRGAKRRKNKRGGGSGTSCSAVCNSGTSGGVVCSKAGVASALGCVGAPAAAGFLAPAPAANLGSVTGINGELKINNVTPQFTEGPVNADFTGVLQTPFTFGLNQRAPYTAGDRCLLCRRERGKDCPRPSEAVVPDRRNGGWPKVGQPPAALPLPLWVCSDCRSTVEKEDRHTALEQLGSQDFLLHMPTVNGTLGPDLAVTPTDRLSAPALPAPDLATPMPGDTPCGCEACNERRELSAESERESRQLQKHWSEVRYVVRCIYRQAGTPLADDRDQPLEPDKEGVKELVDRLCEKDPYQLYQRLEQQAREYVLEMKARLLKQLSEPSLAEGPPRAHRLVSLLLEEYSALCQAARTISGFLLTLENEHLHKFHVTWELHNKHLFENLVFSEPILHSSLPALVAQLKLGTASHDSYSEDTYRTLLENYQRLEREMASVAGEWQECEKRIDDYVDEQLLFKVEGQSFSDQRTEPHKSPLGKNTLKTKQRMLKEDWESFKQRRYVEEQPPNNKKLPCGDNFTDTMRMLSSRLGIPDCPNCNYRRRCACDDCSLSHILTCGIMDSPVSEESAVKPVAPQDYLAQGRPPSLSSASSASGSNGSSPVTVQRRPRLALPAGDANPFVSDDDEVPPMSAKFGDVYPVGGYQGDGVAALNGHRADINGEGAQNLTSPRVSSSASSSDDDEGRRRRETNSPPPSYNHHRQVEQVQHVCECHVCNQDSANVLGHSGRLHSAPPPVAEGHPSFADNGPTRPALHLYPHIHGHLPLHNFSRPLLHPTLYPPSPPLTHNKPLPPNPTTNHSVAKQPAFSPTLPEHVYQNSFNGGGGGGGGTGDWNNSLQCLSLNFESLWDAAVMKSLDQSISQVLLPELLQGEMLDPPPADVPLPPTPASPRAEHRHPLPPAAPHPSSSSPSSLSSCSSSEAREQKKSGAKKKCLYNFQDAFMETNRAAAASVSCTATTVQSNDVFHSLGKEDHRQISPAAPRNNPAPLGPLPPLSAPSLPPTPAAHLPAMAPFPKTAPDSGETHPGLCLPPAEPAVSSADSPLSAPPSVCSDPDCEGHRCEGNGAYEHPPYDGEESQDEDSCSEHSSSTSTSTNQKEGKYCDCCYCEFFGHGGPPSAPTSRNYAEMREKLRLRLTKRKEEQQPKREEQQPAPEREGPAGGLEDHRRVEDLLQFINSADSKPASSSKAAKRARHKQKKMEEKARQEAEAQREERRRRRQEEEAALQRELLRLQELRQQHCAAKKKKKDKAKENTAPGENNPPPLERAAQNVLDRLRDGKSQLLRGLICPEDLRPESRPDARRSERGVSRLRDRNADVKARPGAPAPETVAAGPAEAPASESHGGKRQLKEDRRRSPPASDPSPSPPLRLQSEQNGKPPGAESPQPKGKAKKSKKKKGDKMNTSIDDVFLPKDIDLDSTEMDETEREVEYFKRFCLDSARQTRQRLSINWSNFSLKKATFAAH
ncbi:protein FAM193A isoform X1 [Corythoichthys intestinalis]|uniref:protein FAM193A isoform X1 n=1 Tax=Corythoichthys intestinalis TaxID=161448 RepID=UPI0025A54872|nr:protein FAM193A isoform X1 [Corythoichthys intestinalis]